MITNASPLLALTTRAIAFDRFWSNSRFSNMINGFDCTEIVNRAFIQIQARGGFVCFIECLREDRFLGSLVVYKDPWYRTYKRDDVACFGLVTVSDVETLEALLEASIHELESRFISIIRGPVNVPRSLFGYGVQAGGHERPVVAGSSWDPLTYKTVFAELEDQGFFNTKDRYFNLWQDFDKTRQYIATLDLDRSFCVRNPVLDSMGGLPAQIASMMNRTLGYRPDYMVASPDSIIAAAEMYKLVPGSERLIGLFYDGDKFAGAVMMQPDWFQVFTGQPVTNIIGDIYMLDKAYQGRRLFMNFSEYSIKVLAAWGATYYEHASMWEHMEAIKSSVKNNYAELVKEYWVFEKRF